MLLRQCHPGRWPRGNITERSDVSRFVMKDEVETTTFDWGSAGMRVDADEHGVRRRTW